VAHAVLALPPFQREALILFEYEELSLEEIAAIAGIEAGAVKARLHRARETLRRRLAPLMAARAWFSSGPRSASVSSSSSDSRSTKRIRFRARLRVIPTEAGNRHRASRPHYILAPGR
jgi:hypothetical protein